MGKKSSSNVLLHRNADAMRYLRIIAVEFARMDVQTIMGTSESEGPITLVG